MSLLEQRLSGFADSPLVSVLLVISDPDEVWIKATVSSVLEGAYSRVELCVCDNASERPHVRETLEGAAASDGRVRLRRLSRAVSFAQAHNEALSMAAGRFVVLLGEGDRLAPDALFWVVDLLQNAEADVVYGNEDSVDVSDARSDPVLKPHWSPDMLLSMPYVGRSCVIRRDLLEGLGGFREEAEGAEEHDLMLRVAEKTDRIYHVPKVLYHRRFYSREPVPEGGIPREAALRVVEEALGRRAVEATVDPGTGQGFRVVRNLSGRPAVSVVALVTEVDLVNHIYELEKESSYPLQEVIPTEIAREDTLGKEAATTSLATAANRAAGRATGEYLLFVRNFRRSSSPDWILELLRQARRLEVGAAGGRVLDGDGVTRSAGSFLDSNRLGGSPPNDVSSEDSSRFLPVVAHAFNPLAVSMGCMMLRRSTFEQAGGFDEENLPTAFCDLDLCFRLGERGLLNVYTPYASVVSEEASLPLPSIEEIEYMWNRWWPVLVKALYYKDSLLRARGQGLDEDLLLPLASV